jgi:anaerobic selenocysteine-containing dehydrogenase
LERFYHPDRLNYPLKRAGEKGENKWQQITWDEALDEIATKLQSLKDQYGLKLWALRPVPVALPKNSTHVFSTYSAAPTSVARPRFAMAIRRW